MSDINFKSGKLTRYIFLGMLLGIIVGYCCYSYLPDKATRAMVADNFATATSIFLRLINMVIAPLVLATVITGISQIGSKLKDILRVGIKAMLVFMIASFIALGLGLIFAYIFHPGSGLTDVVNTIHGNNNISTESMTFKSFITRLIPSSIFFGMAKNEVLQIIIFALFFGVAFASMGSVATPLINICQIIADGALKVTNYIMNLAPIAAFTSMCSLITHYGWQAIDDYAFFMGSCYIGLIVLLLIIVGIGYLILGSQVFNLIRKIRNPVVLAFATTSSEVAYPKTLQQLERFGISRKITAFVLTLGYSFNLTGSMFYCTFATMFIAQIYGIHLSLGQQISLLLVLMLTSKGMTGVPRASLVVIAATLPQFNIPDEGLLLLLISIDHFLDMGRSAVNVIGNCVSSAIIAKWEDSHSKCTNSF